MIGIALTLVIARTKGEVWFLVLFAIGAATVAAAGGIFGTRSKRAL